MSGHEQTASSSVTGAPVYVYGFVPGGSLAPLDVEGVAGRPVVTIESDGLGALTSELPEGPLRVRPRDLHRHLDVLEAAFAETTIAACPFGTVVESREALEAEVLAGRRAELLALLRRLEGRVQLNVAAAYDLDTVLREIVAGNPEIARLRDHTRGRGDAGHFASIRLGELVAAALAERRAVDAQKVLDSLTPEAEDVLVEPADDETVLKASFLLAADRSVRFERALDALAAAESPRLVLKSVGPVPPTAFATLSEAV